MFPTRNDSRPYAVIQIYGVALVALLDSGATHSAIGPIARQKISPDAEMKVDPLSSEMVMSSGDSQLISGLATLPVVLKGQEVNVTFRVATSLAYEAILGQDALSSLKVDMIHSRREWYIDQSGPFPFSPFDEITLEAVCGLAEVTPEQEKILQELLKKFLIPDKETRLGCTHLVEHHIDTQGHKPIKINPRTYSPKRLEAMHEKVREMLAEGIIEPSSSEWATPVMMARKSNSDYRFCLDFRDINKIAKKDAYPIPDMTRILSMLRSAHYITTLDLSQAYFQVPLDEASKEVTAFAVPGMGTGNYFNFEGCRMVCPEPPPPFSVCSTV